jgi:hypothetical protein
MLRILRAAWAKIKNAAEITFGLFVFGYIMWDQARRPWRPDKD